MNTITIPIKEYKRLVAAERTVVTVPRREYEEFSQWKKAVREHQDEQWFWTPEWQKKEAEADEAIRAGRMIGPFSSHKQLLAALKKKRK